MSFGRFNRCLVQVGTPLPSGDALPRGWDQNYDAGTAADFYVDGANGSDSNAGTSLGAAKATIGSALTAAASAGTNKTIAIRAGSYREALTITTSHAGLTLKGYGTEKPRIWGGRSLTGWTQCGTGDATVLGSTLGVSDSPVWKVTVAASAIVHPGSLCLYEGDTFIPICQQQTTDLKWYSYYPYYETCDSLTKNGSNNLLTITDTSVLSGITAAQLSDAFALAQVNPNVIRSLKISAYNSGTGTVTVDGLAPVGASTTIRWNLANCPPKMVQGTYAYRDNGDSTWTIYCYPNNAANLAANMTCAERSSLISFNTVHGVSLIGLQIEQTGGVNPDTHRMVSTNNGNGSPISGFTMLHCRARRAHSGFQSSNGDLRTTVNRFWRTNDLSISRCTFEDFWECFCLHPAGTTTSGGASGARITQNVFRDISQAACRVFVQTDVHVTFNDMHGVGRGGHANLTNFYEQCDKVLFWGNRVRDTYAYLTWVASRLVIAFNDIQTSKLDTRAIVDQNDGRSIPTFPSVSYCFHNLTLPFSTSADDDNAIDLGEPYDTTKADGDQPNNHGWHLVNNVIHGGGVVEPYRNYTGINTNWRNISGFDDTQIEREREGNVYTQREFWQAGGWSLRSSEALQETLSSVYEDVLGGDFRAVTGSPILTHTPVSIAANIAACEALFPDFDFSRDADGLPYSPSAPARVGPYQGDYNEQIQWDA